MALHRCELCGAHLAWWRSRSLFRSQGRRVPSGWRESSSASGGRGRWGKTCRTIRTWRHGCSCGTLFTCETMWEREKKDESESESRVQVAGFEHHIIIGFPFFKTDQWMCKLQEDINIFFWKCGNKKCCRNQAEIAVVLSDSLPYRRSNLISQHRHCTVQTRSSFFKLVGISLTL